MTNHLLSIHDFVPQRARVLDLGCGQGELLSVLKDKKDIVGLGVEIDHVKIAQCIQRGVSVIEQDIDKGLANFADKSFDVVLLTQTLQAVRHPDYVLEEMLRVGKECIISFPNFGHWSARLSLLVRGRMPVSKFMPYEWYNTPNIHFCTVKDFEIFCRQKNIRVLNRFFGASAEKNATNSVNTLPNWRAVNAVYRIARD